MLLLQQRHRKRTNSRCVVAFTLVELLVVIAIITVLAALLLPTLEEAIFSSRVTACANNHKQMFLACSLYATDNAGYAPEYGGNAGWYGGNYLADAYRRSMCLGRVIRMGYAPAEVLLEPDYQWIAKPSMGDTFANDTGIHWDWLQPHPTNPQCFAQNHVFGFQSAYLLNSPTDSPWRGRKLRVPHRYSPGLAMCRIDAPAGIKVMCHARRVSNCAFEDGHVRTFADIDVAAPGIVNGSEAQFIGTNSWWTWVKEHDTK